MELCLSWTSDNTKMNGVRKHKRLQHLKDPGINQSTCQKICYQMHLLEPACSLVTSRLCRFRYFCLEQPSGHSSSGWFLCSVRTRLIHQLLQEDLSKLQFLGQARYLSSKPVIFQPTRQGRHTGVLQEMLKHAIPN